MQVRVMYAAAATLHAGRSPVNNDRRTALVQQLQQHRSHHRSTHMQVCMRVVVHQLAGAQAEGFSRGRGQLHVHAWLNIDTAAHAVADYVLRFNEICRR